MEGDEGVGSVAGVIFILYVADQNQAAIFYQNVLDLKPSLNVPGMTEFSLNKDTKIGLMPEKGIKKLLGTGLPDPEHAQGIPRSELYLLVEEPALFHQRALKYGAKELSPLCNRDWGDVAAYSLDPDGHVLAFANPASSIE